jgi:lipoic acid synthetase
MKPDWLKIKIGSGANFNKVRSILKNRKLHTICEEANCPNKAECYGKKIATFLILGDICTRKCGYCNVKSGKPRKVDLDEPKRVADAVRELGLKYAVITSVTRDDLEDGGANQFADTIKQIKNCKVEVLIPDFKGNVKSIKKIINAKPNVIGHNIEVTKNLFNKVRKQGNYNLSLELLKNIKKKSNITTKSGFMVGLGENYNEIIETIEDLRDAKVDILTIGQYLQPSKENLRVEKYYSPAEFENLKKISENIGFRNVIAGPLVRSSYHAKELFENER